MADFEHSIGFTLKNEGGYVDNPNDSGGATNFGITIGEYEAYFGSPATAAEIKAMPLFVAKEIYKAKYWSTMRLDEVVSQGVATAIFDMGVNFGPFVATKMAQEACNKYAPPTVSVDGVLGPMTIQAINLINPKMFIGTFAGIVKAHYSAIVAANPKDHVFYKGWMARSDRLLTLA